MDCYCVHTDARKSNLQNGIKAMDKDRVRKKMKVNCSKGYLGVQKEKLSEWDEDYMLDKTVWETLPSSSVEVFKSSPNCCWAWEKHGSLSPSPDFSPCSCLWCPCLWPGTAACWLCPGRDGQECWVLCRLPSSTFCLFIPREASTAGLREKLQCWCYIPWQDCAGWGCQGSWI